MPLVTPNSQDSPTFQAQAVVDKTDLAALANIAQNYGVVSGCLVSPGGGYTINVASGSIQIGSTQVAVAAVTGLSLIAASPTDRRDIVVSSNVGAVSIVSGTPTAETIIPWAATSLFDPPIKPAIPSNSVLLGEIYIPGGGGTIVASWLTDKTLITIGSAVYLTRHYDGTTDDASSINTQLATLAASGGGTAWLPAGKNPCMITTDILVPGGVRLLGFGPFKRKNPGSSIPSYTANGWLGTCIAPLAGATFTLGMVVLNGNSAQLEQVEVVPGITAPVGVYVNDLGCVVRHCVIWGGTTASLDTAGSNLSQDFVFDTTIVFLPAAMSGVQATSFTGTTGTALSALSTLPMGSTAKWPASGAGTIATSGGTHTFTYTSVASPISLAGCVFSAPTTDTVTNGATIAGSPDTSNLGFRINSADNIMLGVQSLGGTVVVNSADCIHNGCHYSGNVTGGAYNVIVNASQGTVFNGGTIDNGLAATNGGWVRRDKGTVVLNGVNLLNGQGQYIGGSPPISGLLVDNEPSPQLGGFLVSDCHVPNVQIPGSAFLIQHNFGSNPNSVVNGLVVDPHGIVSQNEVHSNCTAVPGNSFLTPASMTGITVGATVYAITGSGLVVGSTVTALNSPAAGQVAISTTLGGGAASGYFAFQPTPTLANLYNGGTPGVSRSVVYGGTLQAELPVSGGTGTVTSASVVSANGLAGTVATPTTTPAITLSTSVTGLLKGNGAAISAAVSGTDYALGTEPIAAAETTRATAAEGTLTTNVATNTTAIATKFTSLARATVVTSTPGAPVAANALIPVDTTAGTVNIPLPVAPADKTLMAIKHVTQGGTNSVTFSCGGSDVFNVTGGVTSKSLPLLNQSALLEYTTTGAIWTVISDALTLTSLDLRYLGIATAIPESQVTNLVTDLARVQRTRRLFTNINF